MDAELLGKQAQYYYEKGELDAAISKQMALIRLTPDKYDAKACKDLAYYLWMGGRYEESNKLFLQMHNLKIKTIDLIAGKSGQPKRALYYYFDGAPIRAIGEFCLASDTLFKAVKLGLLPDIEYVFLLHDKVGLNKNILEYWGRYFFIVHDADQIAALSEAYKHCQFGETFVPTPDTDGGFYYMAWEAVNRRWSEQENPPLLTLDEPHNEEGRKVLKELGMPKDAWFVCLHVRTSSYYGGKEIATHLMKNPEIKDYFPAIREITGRGGWVVRMGDAGMPPLDPMDNVIDYATSPAKSERMDIFLCAACRFFVSTNSGLGTVPSNFGVPTIQTNMGFVSFYSTLDQDLYIHNTLYRKNTREFMTMREMLSPPFVNYGNAYFYDKHKIAAKRNTAEEITDVVVEMLQRLDGEADYSDEDDALLKRYHKATSFEGRNSLGRPGRLFLRNNQHLF